MRIVSRHIAHNNDDAVYASIPLGIQLVDYVGTLGLSGLFNSLRNVLTFTL